MRRLWLAVWGLAGWLAGRRRPKADSKHVRRLTFRDQTRGMSLRIGENTRDTLRGRWLRVSRGDATGVRDD